MLWKQLLILHLLLGMASESTRMMLESYGFHLLTTFWDLNSLIKQGLCLKKLSKVLGAQEILQLFSMHTKLLSSRWLKLIPMLKKKNKSFLTKSISYWISLIKILVCKMIWKLKNNKFLLKMLRSSTNTLDYKYYLKGDPS